LAEGDEKLSRLRTADLTRGQLYALTLRHCLTQAAISDLIELLNSVLPGCLPSNLYYFNKITDVGDALQTNVYCQNCNEYIGKLNSGLKQCVCTNCNNQYSCNDLIKNGHFF